MEYFLLSEEFRDQLLDYLGRCPYNEVAMAVQALGQLKALAVKDSQINEKLKSSTVVG